MIMYTTGISETNSIRVTRDNMMVGFRTVLMDLLDFLLVRQTLRRRMVLRRRIQKRGRIRIPIVRYPPYLGQDGV